MNRPWTSHAVRWEAALGSCLALSAALLPLACGGQTTADATGVGGTATGGDIGSGASGGSGGASNGAGGTGACDVLDEVLSEGGTTANATCDPAMAKTGLGFIAPDDWYNLAALVATDEGLWVAGYESDAGGFVSALSFDGEAEVILTMADAEVSALTLVGGDTLVLAGRGADPEDPTQPGTYLRRATLAGDELWTARFEGSSLHYVAALAPGPGESVYVAVTTEGDQDPSSGGTFLRNYDAAGNLTRHTDLDVAGYLSLEDMAATEEGELYVLVRLDDASSTVLRALSDDGEVLWELPSEELGCSFCHELFAAADGDLYVAGSASGAYGDVSLARVSPGGEVLWASIVSHQATESVSALTVTEDGAYLFGSSNEGEDSRNDALAVHFDPDGEQSSVMTRAGSSRSALIMAAASTPGGDVFVAGYAGPGWTGSGEPHSFVMAWPSAP